MAPSVAPAQDLPTPEAYLGQEKPLSVRDAVFLALQNNLDLQVARTEPAIAEEGVHQAEGAFNPVLFASYRFNRNETPVATGLQIGGAGVTKGNEWNYTGGFAGILPLGLNYASTLNQRRLDSDSSIVSLDPEWRAGWASEITLPLLKDFINNEANVTVKRSRIGRDISNEDFRRRLIDLVAQVESAYWELAAARAGQRVEQKSLHTAQDLLEQTRVRYDVGVVSKVIVTQAEAGVAEREVDAIIADNRAANAQDALLNLVLAPSASDFASTVLVPKDPAFIPYSVDLAEALEKAQSLRPELEQSRQQVKDAELQLAFAENQRLPRLDVTGSYQMDGLSGKSKGVPFFGQPAVPDQGGSSSAFDHFFRKQGAHSWSFGANVDDSARAGCTAQNRAAARQDGLSSRRAAGHPGGTERRPPPEEHHRCGRGGPAARRRAGGNLARGAGEAATGRLHTLRGARVRGRPGRGRTTEDPGPTGLPRGDHRRGKVPGHHARDTRYLGGGGARSLTSTSTPVSPAVSLA
jgi:outer membrane protein TolC